MSSAKTAAERKFFREMDKKAALSEAEKARIATLNKTAKLRKLRLAKEAEELAEEATTPKKQTTPAKKQGQ